VFSLFNRLTLGYRRRMGIARRPEQHIRPVPRVEGLDRYENFWVAVRGGEVVAAAETSRELAYQLRKMGSRAEGAVMQFVRPASDAFIVGIG
jgi:hypothetical protein